MPTLGPHLANTTEAVQSREATLSSLREAVVSSPRHLRHVRILVGSTRYIIPELWLAGYLAAIPDAKIVDAARVWASRGEENVE